MNLPRISLALVALTATLAVSACGGGDGVPADAVAVVDGSEISRQELDELMARAKKAYEAQSQEFPKVGTADYKNVESQYLAFLVQREEFEQEALQLGIKITPKQIDDRLKQIKQQYFQGKESTYKAQLKKQGLTEDQVRDEVRNQLISEKLYEQVTEGVKVTDDEIEKYYNSHKADYKVAESRDVRHILVAKKATANDVYRQLQGGGSFAALAKKYSTDPGSKENGGKLTVRRGETVAEFDKTAFELKKGEMSRPVKTQYGFHIIEALTDVKPAAQTPLKDVKEQIRQQLLQEKRQQAITDWSKELNDEFDGEIAYQVGYAPPATTGTTADR
jgi:parvulin-like peptidyl-prolyl isomerase